MTMANTPVYYNNATITIVKSFIVQAVNIRQEQQWQALLSYYDAAKITAVKSFTVEPINIRQRWKCMAVANTLAYSDAATITAVKIFMVKVVNNRQRWQWKTLQPIKTWQQLHL